MTVESGTGPLLAFASARLLLPVASNAELSGSPQAGDTVVVHAINCPNAEKTVLTTVAATIEAKPGSKKTVSTRRAQSTQRDGAGAAFPQNPGGAVTAQAPVK